MYTRRNDVLHTICIDEGTSNPVQSRGVEIKKGTGSNNGPIWESGLDGSKIVLFSELVSVLVEPKNYGFNGEGLNNIVEIDMCFRAY